MAEELPLYIFQWSPKKEMDQFHSHDHLELGYCLSGEGSFQFGDKTYTSMPGDVFVVNHLEKHAAKSDTEHPNDFYFIYFDPMVIEQVDPELLKPHNNWNGTFSVSFIIVNDFWKRSFARKGRSALCNRRDDGSGWI